MEIYYLQCKLSGTVSPLLVVTVRITLTMCSLIGSRSIKNSTAAVPLIATKTPFSGRLPFITEDDFSDNLSVMDVLTARVSRICCNAYNLKRYDN